MRLFKAGRYKIEDNFENVTLSDSAYGDVQGTREELLAFDAFIENLDIWQAPTVEMESVGSNAKGVQLFSYCYDFDIDRIAEFKEEYKDYQAMKKSEKNSVKKVDNSYERNDLKVEEIKTDVFRVTMTDGEIRIDDMSASDDAFAQSVRNHLAGYSASMRTQLYYDIIL